MVGAGWTEGCPEQLLLCWYALAAIVEQVQKGVEFCDPTRYVAGLNTIFFYLLRPWLQLDHLIPPITKKL